MRPYYQDLDAGITLYHGRAEEVLPQLPAESVHCCITSPPYWGLRRYSGVEPSVWGPSDCEHEWGEEGRSTQRLRNGAGVSTLNGSGVTAGGELLNPGTGQFCRLCGAWYGLLGLEPTPDCGRPFMTLRRDLTEKERRYVLTELEKLGLLE